MKFSVYIATSADGYIATLDGGVDWLHTAGNREADMKSSPDVGFADLLVLLIAWLWGASVWR